MGLLFLSLLTACSPDTEHFFDSSPAIRQHQAAARYADILESAPEGWAMDFYPGGLEFGGIAYTARFRDGQVTLACEQAIDNSSVEGRGKGSYPAGQEVTSDYSIALGLSVVLSFDTYNPLIHYWSQPSGTDYDGYASDYEFTFVSATPGEVVLRGVRHGNMVRLYALAESSADYLQRVAAMRSLLSRDTRKRAVVDGNVVPVTAMENHLLYTVSDSTFDMPYVYTASGIRFYKPVEIAGASAMELDYDTSTESLASADGRFLLPQPTALEHFCGAGTQWHFVFGSTDDKYDMCDALRTLLKTAISQLASQRYESLKDCFVGLNKLPRAEDSQRTVICWTTGYASWAYQVCHGLDMNVADEDKSLVSIQPTGSGNLFYNYSAILMPMLTFIADASPYVVTMEGDESAPTAVLLTSQSDSSLWFRLVQR